MKRFVLLPVVAVAACMESTSPQPLSGNRASAEHLVHQKDEVVSIVVNACNGETVELAGTVHTKADFDFKPDGSFKASTSSKYNLTGVGSVTGVEYQASQKIDDRANVNSHTTVSSHDVSLKLIGKGKVPNSVIRLREHVVIVDGELKVARSDISSRCS